MFLFKAYTFEFEFDRHLEHMVSYKRRQSGLLMFFVIEFSAFEIFMQNDCFAKPDVKNIFDSGIFIKLKTWA